MTGKEVQELLQGLLSTISGGGNAPTATPNYRRAGPSPQTPNSQLNLIVPGQGGLRTLESGGGAALDPLTDQRSTGQSVLDLFTRGLGGVEKSGDGKLGGLSREQKASIDDEMSKINTGDYIELIPGWKSYRGVSPMDVWNQKSAARNKGMLAAEKKEEEARLKKEDRAIKKETAQYDRIQAEEAKAGKKADRALAARKVRVQELELARRMFGGKMVLTPQDKDVVKKVRETYDDFAAEINRLYGRGKEEQFEAEFSRLVSENAEYKINLDPRHRDMKEPRMRLTLILRALEMIGLDPESLVSPPYDYSTEEGREGGGNGNGNGSGSGAGDADVDFRGEDT